MIDPIVVSTGFDQDTPCRFCGDRPTTASHDCEKCFFGRCACHGELLPCPEAEADAVEMQLAHEEAMKQPDYDSEDWK